MSAKPEEYAQFLRTLFRTKNKSLAKVLQTAYSHLSECSIDPVGIAISSESQKRKVYQFSSEEYKALFNSYFFSVSYKHTTRQKELTPNRPFYAQPKASSFQHSSPPSFPPLSNDTLHQSPDRPSKAHVTIPIRLALLL